ncbi:EamA family transporter [Candidatus Peregrinibacteria bacterium]|nr:EamA family transporter [Candidatus Peregrinibacteria bacterium]
MNFLYPILAAILQSGSFTLDKVVLSLKHITFQTYTGISFPLSFAITFIIFLIFEPPLFSQELFAGNLFFLITLSVIIKIITNLIFYRALHDDHLAEIQTLELLPRFSVLLGSSIFFADERNYFIVFPSFIATFAVIWSHFKHHHFHIAKHTAPFLIWSVISAPIDAAILKTLLMTWNPISLELIRSAMMALVLFPLFSKHTENISGKAMLLFILTNTLSCVAWILFYTSYQHSGIIYTLLLFSIQPLLVYFAAVIFLKDKLEFKKTVAFFVVLVSIIIAQVAG